MKGAIVVFRGRIPLSLRGLFIASGIIALGLPAAVAGLFGILRNLEAINDGVARVRNAQLSAAAVLQYEQDEQIAIRGLAATGRPQYEAQFVDAYTRLRIQSAELGSLLTLADDARARDGLADALRANDRWRVTIAEPVLARRVNRLRIAEGSPLVARFRDDMEQINATLSNDYAGLIVQRGKTIALESGIGFGAVVLMAVQALVSAVFLTRLRFALDRERAVAQVLHAGFAGTLTGTSALAVGTAYVSATRGAKVGGDVYDVYRIDDDTTLLMIADVSGKGVEAAVDTMFVKYGLRALTTDRRDITSMVRTFNMLYANAGKPPEAFVSMFVATYHRRDGVLHYVNAGHEAAYVRRKTGVERLPPTDPIIGLAHDAEFHAGQTALGTDDILFLATDGLTEARDADGTFLGDAGVQKWLRETQADSPQALVDAVGERLRRYARTRLGDDLAILAVAPRDAAASGSTL